MERPAGLIARKNAPEAARLRGRQTVAYSAGGGPRRYLVKGGVQSPVLALAPPAAPRLTEPLAPLFEAEPEAEPLALALW